VARDSGWSFPCQQGGSIRRVLTGKPLRYSASQFPLTFDAMQKKSSKSLAAIRHAA
jgi:hypothetical protein